MIFLVEDDNAARDSFRFLLECEGLEVEDFPSAEAFLNAYPAKGDGCLIVDVNMPGMSGLELLEYLRRNGNDLAVIVVTGLPSIATKTRAERARAGFLEKPFSGRGDSGFDPPLARQCLRGPTHGSRLTKDFG